MRHWADGLLDLQHGTDDNIAVLPKVSSSYTLIAFLSRPTPNGAGIGFGVQCYRHPTPTGLKPEDHFHLSSTVGEVLFHLALLSDANKQIA
jgi:hypothetical protein